MMINGLDIILETKDNIPATIHQLLLMYLPQHLSDLGIAKLEMIMSFHALENCTNLFALALWN